MALHVIFDMDGTLLDTEFETSVITADLAREKGWNISPEEVFREHAGLGSAEKFISIAKTFGAVPSASDLAYLSHEHEHRKSLIYTRDDIPVMPNALKALQSLAGADTLLSLGSSNPSARSKSGLDKTGLRKYFGDRIYGPDLVGGKKKPDPAVFLQAMKDAGSKPENTAVVEDSEAGIRAGRAAGATVIALLDPRFGTGIEAEAKAEAFKKAGADIVIRDLSEVPLVLASRLLPSPQKAALAKTARLSP